MKIIRVFPSRTNATPDDTDVAINRLPYFFEEADQIHISVAFTWHLPIAEWLETQWRHVAPVQIGGPAMGMKGEDFIPGKYIKEGYVITSRGCPNRCWFCSVWRREGQEIRELKITEGYNLLDDNILACSEKHIKAVFTMLADGKKKYKKSVELTGGLEASLLRQWHVDALKKLKPKRIFFAYDTPDDLEPLRIAGKMLFSAGWSLKGQTLRAYVLCGYNGDTFEAAEKRMNETIKAGFVPMAMLYRNHGGKYDINWRRWQRQWVRPALIHRKIHRSQKGMSNSLVDDMKT